MIFCSLVIVAVLSKRRARALRTPTTPRPASASASAMTPTVRLSLNYCNVVPLGMLIETARRHVVDHALAQRADGLVEHRESSCLAWGSKPHDLETERRLALPRPPNPSRRRSPPNARAV